MKRIRRSLVALSLSALLSVGLAGSVLGAPPIAIPCQASNGYDIASQHPGAGHWALGLPLCA